jgi:Glyoxalase-like domain
LARWRIGSVAIDCDDHRRLGAFYSGLLDTEIVHDTDSFCALRVDALWLLIKTVPNHAPPTWPEGAHPQQKHLDFAVDDLDSAEAVALAAGARKATFQPAPDNWRVMIDPGRTPVLPQQADPRLTRRSSGLQRPRRPAGRDRPRQASRASRRASGDQAPASDPCAVALHE